MTVSVIMTCHNEARFIAQAVRSVAAQTARGRIAEILVVNDGSTDDSVAVLAGLAREIPILRVITTTGLGLPAARNVAIKASTGSIVAILDGDDLWMPEKLERQLPYVDGDARVGLIYSDFVDFTRDDGADAQLITVRRFTPQSGDTLADYFVHDAPIVPSTVLIPRQVFDDVGMFDEQIRIGEDTEMFLRIAERWRFQHVPGGLTFKRRHDQSITRRLDTLLPVARLVTERFIQRNPRLYAFARRRMARRYAKVGNDYARRGETRLALSHLGRSFAQSPSFPKAYAYLALAILPTGTRNRLRMQGSRVLHGGLARLRRA